MIVARLSQRLPGVARGPRFAKLNLHRQQREFSDFSSLIYSLNDTLVQVHQQTQLPWWALIPLTTVAFRTAITLPLAVLNRKRMVKQISLRPVVDAMYPVLKLNLIKKKTKDAGANAALQNMGYEQIVLLSLKEKKKRQKKLFKENNCEVWKNFTLPMFQVPLWVTLSLTIRHLSGWNSTLLSTAPEASRLEPSLMSEGLLWFTDLAQADPYGVLPVLLGTACLSNIEYMSRFNVGSFYNSSYIKETFSNRLTLFDSVLNISRISVVFFMAVASQAPAALCLYWISSNVFSLVQNVLFQKLWPLRDSYYVGNSSGLVNESKLLAPDHDSTALVKGPELLNKIEKQDVLPLLKSKL